MDDPRDKSTAKVVETVNKSKEMEEIRRESIHKGLRASTMSNRRVSLMPTMLPVVGNTSLRGLSNILGSTDLVGSSGNLPREESDQGSSMILERPSAVKSIVKSTSTKFSLDQLSFRRGSVLSSIMALESKRLSVHVPLLKISPQESKQAPPRSSQESILAMIQSLHSLNESQKSWARRFLLGMPPQNQIEFLEAQLCFRSFGYEWTTASEFSARGFGKPLITSNTNAMPLSIKLKNTLSTINMSSKTRFIKNGIKDTDSKIQLKIPVISQDEGYLQKKPQLVYALGNSFTRGGDVRDPLNGRLIFSVHKKRVAGQSSIFLLDDQKVPIWKLSERPGEAGMNYDLYGRSSATGCGAAGWRLRGHIDRAAVSATTLPRFTIHCMGATVALAAYSMGGDRYVFHDILTTEVVGTLNTKSQKITGEKTDDDGEVFYEQMQLAFDAPIESLQDTSFGKMTPLKKVIPISLPPVIVTSPLPMNMPQGKKSLVSPLSNSFIPSLPNTPAGRQKPVLQKWALPATDLSSLGTPKFTNVMIPTEKTQSLDIPVKNKMGLAFAAGDFGGSKSIYQDKFRLKISAANTTIAARHNCLPLSQLVLPPEMFLAGALVVLFMIREERSAILKL